MNRLKVVSRLCDRTGVLMLQGVYKKATNRICFGFGLDSGLNFLEPEVILGGSEMPLGVAYFTDDALQRFIRSKKRMYISTESFLCYVMLELSCDRGFCDVLNIDTYMVSPYGVRSGYTYLDRVTGDMAVQIGNNIGMRLMGLGELQVFKKVFNLGG